MEEPRPGAARLRIIVDAFQEGQLTVCLKSSKPIQIGLCMLMTLSIHLHGLHLDAQYDQTRHLSTQWREDWSSASVVNHTIVTDPTI